VIDGNILAAAQEERFTRKKGDERFPINAVKYCLDYAGLGLNEIDNIVFYDDPNLKYDRLINTYLSFAPKGIKSFVEAMKVWRLGKRNLTEVLRDELIKVCPNTSMMPPISYVEHHQSHAASAFFPSPFQEAAILCLDGVGEWATTSIWSGRKNRLMPHWTLDFPHSLGLLYSAFTYYIGFKVNTGEYKLMGLAPYGEPKYTKKILDNLIDLKEDGTFRLNMDYFDFHFGFKMTNENFHNLFGGLPRKRDTSITQKEMDIARSIQDLTEEIILRLVRTVKNELQKDYLCIAGGVGLNCVANGRILREGLFKDIWIQPAAGDAGGSLGAALYFYHQKLNRLRQVESSDSMKGAFLGPSFNENQIHHFLDSIGAKYIRLDDDDLFKKMAARIADGSVIGWFQGKMEFGPRALGSRSIIGDARNPKMQQTMNLKVKFRESFRPFAPAVLNEAVSEYFEIDRSSPYMLFVTPVKEELCNSSTEDDRKLFGIERLNVVRSKIPAVTHIDYSARIQTVHADTNPRFYRLISAFKELTDCPVIINTSFNVRGEPIVCTPEDAYRCFMRTNIDILVLENYILDKRDQMPIDNDEDWKEEFELD